MGVLRGSGQGCQAAPDCVPETDSCEAPFFHVGSADLWCSHSAPTLACERAAPCDRAISQLTTLWGEGLGGAESTSCQRPRAPLGDPILSGNQALFVTFLWLRVKYALHDCLMFSLLKV